MSRGLSALVQDEDERTPKVGPSCREHHRQTSLDDDAVALLPNDLAV